MGVSVADSKTFLRKCYLEEFNTFLHPSGFTLHHFKSSRGGKRKRECILNENKRNVITKSKIMAVHTILWDYIT